jgi:hypothetical protein
MSYCKVAECRFSFSHVTKGHKCGKCKKYGHGEIECSNGIKLNELIKFYNDTIDNKCMFGGCKYSHLHKTDAHHCSKCNQRLHSNITCGNLINIICPLCKQNNCITYEQKKIVGLDIKCCVCLENNVEIYMPTCGHTCLCGVCFNTMTNRTENIKHIDKKTIDKIKSLLPTYPSYTIIALEMGTYVYIRRRSVSSPLQELFIGPDDINYNNQNYHNHDEFINGYALYIIN